MLPAVSAWPLCVSLPVTRTSFGLLPHPAASSTTAVSRTHRLAGRMMASSGSLVGDDLAVCRADHQAERRRRDGVAHCPHAAVAEQELGAGRRRRTPVAAAAGFAADGPSGAGHQIGKV